MDWPMANSTPPQLRISAAGNASSAANSRYLAAALAASDTGIPYRVASKRANYFAQTPRNILSVAIWKLSASSFSIVCTLSISLNV